PQKANGNKGLSPVQSAGCQPVQALPAHRQNGRGTLLPVGRQDHGRRKARVAHIGVFQQARSGLVLLQGTLADRDLVQGNEVHWLQHRRHPRNGFGKGGKTAPADHDCVCLVLQGGRLPRPADTAHQDQKTRKKSQIAIQIWSGLYLRMPPFPSKQAKNPYYTNFVMYLTAKYTSLNNAISEVKAPLVLVTLRTWRWNPSIVLVVYINFRLDLSYRK